MGQHEERRDQAERRVLEVIDLESPSMRRLLLALAGVARGIPDDAAEEDDGASAQPA